MSNIHNEVTTTIMVWIKTFGYAVAVFTFDYLGIPEQQFAILWMLMVVDTMTGIAKAYTVDPQSITSHALGKGVLKKCITVVLVYTMAILGLGVGISAEHFMEWGLSLLIMSEGYSALQNIYAVRTGVVLPEYDVISIIIKKLGLSIKKKLDELTPPSSPPPWNE